MRASPLTSPSATHRVIYEHTILALGSLFFLKQRGPFLLNAFLYVTLFHLVFLCGHMSLCDGLGMVSE